MQHIVIIGNGIAGTTAARHIRKLSSHRITIISSETQYFYSRTALMYVYMGHMKFANTKPYEDSFWKKNRLELLLDHVDKVDTTAKTLQLKSGNAITYDILLIATGSRANKFDWPGQNLAGVQSLYSIADLQQMEVNTKETRHAVIVGGGLIGIEMAEMLLSRNIPVTFLVREPDFWNNVLPAEDAKLISNHIRSHHIDLRLETELLEIHSDDRGFVNAVTTSGGETIPCEFVGLTVGVSPAIDFLKGSEIRTNRGVLVDEFLQTNVPDVYALGDCVERTYELPDRRQIEQVWYTGRMMGEVVAQTVCGEKTPYRPGPWFNSAKFIDIEYQTYGNVRPSLAADEDDFFWVHPDGGKAMHFVWHKNTGQFLGINAFGIRLRHISFDRWIREKKSIKFVVDNLPEANFDPEFFARHEPAIQRAFASSFHRDIIAPQPN